MMSSSLTGNHQRKYPQGEATRIYSLSKEEIPMAKVVYRGNEYDTEHRRQQKQQLQQEPQQYNEVYRGVKFVKKEVKWKLHSFSI